MPKGNDPQYRKARDRQSGKEVGSSDQSSVASIAQEQPTSGQELHGCLWAPQRELSLPAQESPYTHGAVRISASPDLAVYEDGKLKLVKLGIKKQADNPEVVRIMLRVIYRSWQKVPARKSSLMTWFTLMSQTRPEFEAGTGMPISQPRLTTIATDLLG